MVQQDRAARTRAALVQAAAEVFAQEGFVSTSLSTISQRAGVSNGALHFHFKNKDMLAQTVEAAAAATIQRITRKADEHLALPLQRLIDATHALMRALDEDVVVRAGMELAGAAPRRNEAVDLRGVLQHWIERVLDLAQQEHGLPDGVSPASASIAVVAATVGFETLGCKDPKWVSRSTLCQYWELMLPRLAPPEMLKALDPYGKSAGLVTPGT